MGGVISGIGSVVGPIVGSLLQPGASGSSPLGSAVSGLVTSQANKPQGQTQPGAFYPPSGQGLAYNYIPTGQAGVDQSFLNQLGYQTGTGTTAANLANPMLATLLRNIMNDPTMGGAATAGQWAGQLAGNLVGPTIQQGQGLNQAVMGALPQFQQILAQGMDPQSALYDRTLGQLRDQIGANLAETGLTGSGAGAAISDQALSNFNIDWQNQQLSRALSAMQGFGGAMGQAGNVLGQGQQLQGAGVQEALQSGMIPYQTGQTLMTGQQQGLQNYLSGAAGAQNLGNQNLGQMLAYLGVGQQGNVLAQNQALGGLQSAQQQNAAASAALSPLVSSGLSGIGSGLSALYNLFAGSGGSSIPGGNPLYSGGYSGGLGAGTTVTGADY